ncbi:hypothetical protein P879_02185 [Paragonimus westermani]|uniref:Uncharacterized protein n=1 Tax=Paragonimus westermani TaxID=34504 RepID=A0A8T0DN78_9TREM|nr:hypothetical protein P879_02185 [Paragonimus westermani]
MGSSLGPVLSDIFVSNLGSEFSSFLVYVDYTHNVRCVSIAGPAVLRWAAVANRSGLLRERAHTKPYAQPARLTICSGVLAVIRTPDFVPRPVHLRQCRLRYCNPKRGHNATIYDSLTRKGYAAALGCPFRGSANAKRLEMPGFEPGAFRMQSGRSTTELHPPLTWRS